MDQQELKKLFIHPSLDVSPRPLWMWNGTPRKEELWDLMKKSRDLAGHGGFHVIPFEHCGLEYMSDEYIAVYTQVLENAEKLGMKICLYDEWGFPSGTAAGQMKEQYPEHCTKRLDKIETDVPGPILYNQPVNIFEAESDTPGRIMSAVAMNKKSLERLDLRPFISEGYLKWDVPEGEWKIMIFICLPDGWDRVDYLDTEAVGKFIELTHEKYYSHFSDYFGTVIDGAFYDEPNLYKAYGRTWTDKFNIRFEEEFGYSPELLYPALWHDIGPDTAAARNVLLGFRAELYSKGFPGTINTWCREHGIKLTGHVDQEEMINPVGICGDLMKAFKYQDIPGIDEIFFPGRARKVYKVVSSSAYNWGKTLVMSEIFGAMGEDITFNQMKKELLEQFVKGINYIVPHAIWLDNDADKILFPPELSFRSQKFGSKLKELNSFTARLSTVMQRGYAVSDIAVLYPIHSLQGSYRFDSYEAYTGGPVSRSDDYQELGEIIFSDLKYDYQFLHPESMDEFCKIEKGLLCFDNGVFLGQFRVIVVPGSSVISMSNLDILQSFYEQGGTVIAATQLPSCSNNFNENEKVIDGIRSLFSIDNPLSQNQFSMNRNDRGGRAYFVPDINSDLLGQAIFKGIGQPDLLFLNKDKSRGLSYQHKIVDGKNIYLIVNTEKSSVDAQLSLRGNLDLEIWNPQSGEVYKPSRCSGHGNETIVDFKIDALESMILMQSV